MDEVINKRGHINVTGIPHLRVSKSFRLYHLLYGVHIVLDVVKLFWRQLFLLRVNARPDDLSGHVALANAWNFRGESGIIFIVGVDAQQVTTRHIKSRHAFLPYLRDIHTLFATLDGFREDVNATIFTVQRQFNHPCARPPMPHVTPQLECQRVAYCRHIAIGCQQHPVAVGRHTQQRCLHILTLLITQLDGVFLLIEP